MTIEQLPEFMVGRENRFQEKRFVEKRSPILGTKQTEPLALGGLAWRNGQSSFVPSISASIVSAGGSGSEANRVVIPLRLSVGVQLQNTDLATEVSNAVGAGTAGTQWQKQIILKATDSERQKIRESLEISDKLIDAALKVLDSGDKDLMAKVFHVPKDAPDFDRLVKRLRRHYKAVRTVLNTSIISVDNEKKETHAYVVGKLPIIFLCMPTFKESPEERAETLVHEASHIGGLSDDFAYQWEDKFGKLQTWQCTLNADTIALFARRAYQQQKVTAR